MVKRIFAVGERVDKWCEVCREERGHVVASVNGVGRISRVKCPICGTRTAFKAQGR